MKPAKILFFVDGPAPTPEDFTAAASLEATVVFRNARAVPSEKHSLEICDGVAGAVPPIYAAAFPKAAEAIAKKKAELKALSSRVGDTPAPQRNKAQEAAQADQAKQSAATAEDQKQKQDADKKEGEKQNAAAAPPPAWTPNKA